MPGRASDNLRLRTSPPPERPIANSYRIVPGRFAAGEYPGSLDHSEAVEKITALLDSEIDRFIDHLTEPGEGTHHGELKPYIGTLEAAAGNRKTTPPAARDLRAGGVCPQAEGAVKRMNRRPARSARGFAPQRGA